MAQIAAVACNFRSNAGRQPDSAGLARTAQSRWGAHRSRAGMIRPASLQCGSCPVLELDNEGCIQDAPPRNIGRGPSRALQLSEDSLMLNV